MNLSSKFVYNKSEMNDWQQKTFKEIKILKTVGKLLKFSLNYPVIDYRFTTKQNAKMQRSMYIWDWIKMLK